jgi:hypothetical protein
VRDHGDDPGGRERSNQTDREDRRRRPPKPPPTDIEAAVEEDHDQSNYCNALHGLDRHRFVDARPDVGRCGGGDQEERRRRHRNTFSETRRKRCERKARGHDQDESGEVGDLGHGDRRRPDFPALPPQRYTARITAALRSAAGRLVDLTVTINSTPLSTEKGSTLDARTGGNAWSWPTLASGVIPEHWPSGGCVR